MPSSSRPASLSLPVLEPAAKEFSAENGSVVSSAASTASVRVPGVLEPACPSTTPDATGGGEVGEDREVPDGSSEDGPPGDAEKTSWDTPADEPRLAADGAGSIRFASRASEGEGGSRATGDRLERASEEDEASSSEPLRSAEALRAEERGSLPPRSDIVMSRSSERVCETVESAMEEPGILAWRD